MNIISGIAKGIILDVPKGLSVRPTGARAKKSLFDSYNNWNDIIMVDLFSGTGAIGLEAASRGATEVYFVENIRKNCKYIKDNIEKIQKAGVQAHMELICSDALNIHKVIPLLSGTIDVIFADPPYNTANEAVNKILTNQEFLKWAGKADFIFEVPSELSRKPVFDNINLWKIKNRRKLGQSFFYIFEANN